MSEMRLYDNNGQRLYLNPAEREAFAKAANTADRRVKALCLTLLHTGCRVSEALELTPRRVDLEDCTIAFRSLKKRKDKKTGKQPTIYRIVPVPPSLAETLDLVYGVREIQQRGRPAETDAPLWGISRVTAWTKVKQIMDAAEIADGAHKTPKGLRHAYGIHATRSGAPLNMLQKWLGHADMKTTAVYADAIGAEEREIAGRMWTT